MMAGNKAAFVFIALSLLSIMLISGCTSNKFTPCCVKEGIFDSDEVVRSPPQCIYPNGTVFGNCDHDFSANDSKVALCTNSQRCSEIKSEDDCARSYNCNWAISGLSGSCDSDPAGAYAQSVLPVCIDAIPSSCLNNRCTAMMCGYSDAKPSPPPSSKDWVAQMDALEGQTGEVSSVLPSVGMEVPTINLQGTYCSFEQMGRALYNKVKKSQGALWVNAFRFGVGKSFSDYEQARNYFPISDRECGANPNGRIERFTNYLGMKGNWCKPTDTYYKCTIGGTQLYFADSDTRDAMCPLPGISANIIDPSNPRYACISSGLAWGSQSDCMSNCDMTAAPQNTCSDDVAKFPFLNTVTRTHYMCRNKVNQSWACAGSFANGYETNDSCNDLCGSTQGQFATCFCQQESYAQSGEGAFMMSYVADYMVSAQTTQIGSSQAVLQKDCPTITQGPSGDSVTNQYNYCGGYEDSGGNPQSIEFSASQAASEPPWSYMKDYGLSTQMGDVPIGPYNQYYDNHAYTGLQMDYNSYNWQLSQPYMGYNITPDPTAKYTWLNIAKPSTDYTEFMNDPKNSLQMEWECKGDMDCLSGTCDKSGRDGAHRRTVCEIDPTPLLPGNGDNTTIDCGCNLVDGGSGSYLDCARGYSPIQNNWAGNTPLKWVGELYNDDYDEPIYVSNPSGSYAVDMQIVELTPNLFDRPAMDGRTYAYLVPVDGSNKNDFFTRCDLQHLSPNDWSKGYVYEKYFCVYWIDEMKKFAAYSPGAGPGFDCTSVSRLYNIVGTDGDVTLTSTSSNAMYRLYVISSDDDVWPQSSGTWGKCKVGSTAVPPVVDATAYGWCASCTYATMAKQTVTWGDSPAGGVDDPDFSAAACYEWRGTYSYSPGTYHGAEEFSSSQKSQAPVITINAKSVAPVIFSGELAGRQSAKSSPDKGNIFEIAAVPFPFPGSPPKYTCEDNWNSPGDWWSEWPTPSAPYLRDRLTSYLQSNIMPVLDETSSTSSLAALGTGTITTVPYSAYNPLAMCSQKFGASGASIHVIKFGGADASRNLNFDASLAKYADYEEFASLVLKLPSDGSVTNLDATGSTLQRAYLLKKVCEVPPLVAIAVDDNYMRTENFADEENDLHIFFLRPDLDDGLYERRKARAEAETYSDNVDLIAQAWHPTCDNGGADDYDRARIEIEGRLNQSAALLANFSKPSLIWEFSFPTTTLCNEAVFMSFLFNNTAAMVDTGLIGIIYDEWGTQSGKPFGPDEVLYPGADSIKTGLDYHMSGTYKSLADMNNRRIDPSPNPGWVGTLTPASAPVKTNLFCTLQSEAKKVIGLVPLTYGQKEYADAGACACVECDMIDKSNGNCKDTAAYDPGASPQTEDPQYFCDDGNPCAMPADVAPADYKNYKCQPKCMDAAKCTLCTDPAFSESQSFCTITEYGGAQMGAVKPYSSMSDENWEFLTGLPAQDKCCLASNPGTDAERNYTYVAQKGAKTRSEFLQFPRKGEESIDCGRTLDTSVLTYCNVRVAISQKDISCVKIE